MKLAIISILVLFIAVFTPKGHASLNAANDLSAAQLEKCYLKYKFLAYAVTDSEEKFFRRLKSSNYKDLIMAQANQNMIGIESCIETIIQTSKNEENLSHTKFVELRLKQVSKLTVEKNRRFH
ncbi:hypothetical protein CIK05_13980 [Bdellovibrio sp. qaytius]|nr:hypothetical protein CIK05_13980 [Bdellovibrio sp. qaytius]